jgi:hypothetical protein
MATIDLGKIKFNWRGTYAGGTAYVPDDVVYYMDGSVGSSYMCVANTTGNAPSSGGTPHASWQYLAKGQATSPTTTQGDLIVRGASADERLAIGSAGQSLQVNGSGNGLTYGTVTQAVKKIYSKRDGARHAVSNQVQNNAYTSMWNWTNMEQAITPQSNTSKFHITGSLNISHYGSYEGFVVITYQHSGLSGETAVVSNSQTDIRRTHRGNLYGDSGSTMMGPVPLDLIIEPATTNAVTFRIRLGTYNSGYPWHVNRDGSNTTNNSDGGGVLSSWTITELDGAQVTLNQNDVILDT